MRNLALFWLIYLSLISNFSAAQSKNETNFMHRDRITSQRLKSLIKSKSGVLDTLFTNEYFNDVYILNDGAVVVDFTTHGYLYKSKSDLKNWIDYLSNKYKINTPSHILKERLLYGEEFTSHIDALVDTIVQIFHLSNKKPSLDNLKVIDSILQSKKINITNLLYTGIVAYTGEVMKSELPGSNWNIVEYKGDNSIWEPYIKQGNKMYNPFFPVYHELFEEYPETGAINICSAIKNEINN